MAKALKLKFVSHFILFFSCFVVIVTAEFVTTPPFLGQKYAAVASPRGLVLDPAGDILVVSSKTSTITALYERRVGVLGQNGTVVEIQTKVFPAVIVDGSKSNLNLSLSHGIAYHDKFLYASSPSTVYRWPYTPGQRRLVSQEPQIVISGIPTPGHNTRTLAFDSQGRLYVSIGSQKNVDPGDSTKQNSRALIRRFDLRSLDLKNGGVPIESGELVASGLRNSVGLTFDRKSALWAVDNGADDAFRSDLGGDIHNTNPGEELNRVDASSVGQFYGYPFCFSSYKLKDFPAGTQFAWSTFLNDSVHTDAWCRDVKNNHPPILSMPAHYAPLGIQFYDGRHCDKSEGAFPCSMTGDIFVAFHGSWNSDLPVGYQVAWLPVNKTSGLPTGEINPIILESNTKQCLGGNDHVCFRPVNAIFDKNGHLIISADSLGEIFRVTHGVPMN